MQYPYTAKISEELDHSKFYRGKLVSPGHVVEISGPEDEKIWKGFLIPFHEETEEEKEAAIAKPFLPSFTHNSHPKPPGIDSLSDELKGKTSAPAPEPAPIPTPEPEPDKEPAPEPKAEPASKESDKNSTNKAGGKNK